MPRLSTGVEVASLSRLPVPRARIDVSTFGRYLGTKKPRTQRARGFSWTRSFLGRVSDTDCETRMTAIVPPKHPKRIQMGTIAPMLEHLKTVISVLWQTARMVHAWSGNNAALAN